MSNLTDKQLFEEIKKRFICFETSFINRDDMEMIVEDDEKELSVELFEEFKEYVDNYESSYLWEFLLPQMQEMWKNFKEKKMNSKNKS